MLATGTFGHGWANSVRGLGVEVAPDGSLVLPDAPGSAAVVSALVAAGVRVSEFRKLVRTLEDFYLETTG